MKFVLAGFLVLVALADAAESECMECRKAALETVTQCYAAARTDVERDACVELAQEETRACNQGACMADG